jgi:chromosome segregation ATPase
MDLSKSQKTRRNAVEDPLFRTEQLLDELEETETRIDAAMQVWPETKRTLQPALNRLKQYKTNVASLQKELALLWKHGAASKWK